MKSNINIFDIQADEDGVDSLICVPREFRIMNNILKNLKDLYTINYKRILTLEYVNKMLKIHEFIM